MKNRLSLYEAARSAGVTFSRKWTPKSKFVRANGLNFHYLEWGSPDNPVILLLHGFAQQAHSWDFVSLSFADRYRVIALDQRGHGDSDWAADGDYSTEIQQIDIKAIVDALSLNKFILMGLSMGGRNAFTYAAHNPEKIKALIIVDAGPANLTKGSKNIQSFVEQGDELNSVEDFVARVMKYNPRRDPVQIRGSIVNNLKQLPNGNWTWKYDKALRAPGAQNRIITPEIATRLWKYLESLQCPTLVVKGDRSDVFSGHTADEMLDRIPNAQLAVVENAGHLVTGDNPSGFEKAVTNFIQNISGQGNVKNF